MLILERCARESLKIGEEIEVKVLSIRNGKARIGIVCPVTVKVYRNEVFDKIDRPKRKGT